MPRARGQFRVRHPKLLLALPVFTSAHRIKPF
jgi:hypothetical protein